MRHGRLALLLTLALALALPSWTASAEPARPALHEEAGWLLDQVADHLLGLLTRLDQQLAQGGSPHDHQAQPGQATPPGMAPHHGPMGPGMMGPGMMGPGMMGPGRGGPMGHGPGPAERPLITIMLHHRQDLDLTTDQVARLEGLRDDFAREAIRRGADLRIAELDLAAILARDPVDLARAEAKIREAAQLRADLRVSRLKTIEQGKAALTPEQRAKLDALLKAGPPTPPGPGGGRAAGRGRVL